MRLRKGAGDGSGPAGDPEPRAGAEAGDTERSGGAATRSAGLSDDQRELIERHEAEVALLQAPASRTLERWTGLTMVALSVLGVYGSQHIKLRNHVNEAFGPRWWPTALCVISLALSIALTAVAFIRPPFEREGVERSTREGLYKLLLTLVIEALFIVAWMMSGNFVIPAAVMLALMLWVYGSRNWKMLIAFPVITIALIYLLFDLLLQIPL